MMRLAMMEQLESRLFLSGVVSGDFTGDGITDIVTTQGGLKLRVGNGNGTFKAGVPINGSGFARGASVAAADFNNDGSLDLVVFGGTSTSAALKRVAGPRAVNGGLFVLLNNGNGTFQRPFSVDSGVINSTKIIGGTVTTGDFTLNGNQDILVTNASSSATPTPAGTTAAPTGAAVETSFGGVTTNTNSGFFASSPGGFNGLTGATGDEGLLGGLSGGGGTTGTFGTTTSAPATTMVGAVGPPSAAAGVAIAYVIDGNGNGTFQAPRRIVLT